MRSLKHRSRSMTPTSCKFFIYFDIKARFLRNYEICFFSSSSRYFGFVCVSFKFLGTEIMDHLTGLHKQITIHIQLKIWAQNNSFDIFQLMFGIEIKFERYFFRLVVGTNLAANLWKNCALLIDFKKFFRFGKEWMRNIKL